MSVETTRRGLLTGLGLFLAAPAIVRAGSLMPVKVWAPKPQIEPQTSGAAGIQVGHGPPLHHAPKGTLYYAGNAALYVNVDGAANWMQLRAQAG